MPSSTHTDTLPVQRIVYALAATAATIALYVPVYLVWYGYFTSGLAAPQPDEARGDLLRGVLVMGAITLAPLPFTFYRQATAWVREGAFPRLGSLGTWVFRAAALNVALLIWPYTFYILLVGEPYLLLLAFLAAGMPVIWRASEILVRSLFYGKGERRPQGGAG